MISDVYWIDSPVLGRGKLAVSARPRGGDWLDDEVKAWRRAGVGHVVSLLTPPEVRELDLDAERTACGQFGIDFTAVPVPDRGVPPSAADFRRIAKALYTMIQHGEGVLVHCRQGIGRASIMAAAILAEAGVDAETALDLVERVRGRPVPDTDEQRTWLVGLMRLRAPAQQPAGADRAPRGR